MLFLVWSGAGGVSRGGCCCVVYPVQDDERHAADHHEEAADQEDGGLEGTKTRIRMRTRMTQPLQLSSDQIM